MHPLALQSDELEKVFWEMWMVPELPLNTCLKPEHRCDIMIVVLFLSWKIIPACDYWLAVKQNFMAAWTGCRMSAVIQDGSGSTAYEFCKKIQTTINHCFSQRQKWEGTEKLIEEINVWVWESGSQDAGCHTGNPQTTNWLRPYQVRDGSKQCVFTVFLKVFTSGHYREISSAQCRYFCFLGALFLRSYLLFYH